MRTVSTAIRLAVLAGLAATSACGSNDSCTVTRPNPIPTPPPLGTAGGCSKATYDVSVSDLSACGFDAGDCSAICGGSISATCTETSPLHFTCTSMLCGKARTSLRWRRRKEQTPLAEHLAASVWLEAASIHAFYTLADELAAHGAPAALRRAAIAAARDEARHTSSMREIARAHGVRARVPRARRKAPRSLVAVAIENAVEGCVHETYGAALAAFQARRAPDAGTRRAMRAIARDEARHAELAAAIAKWADARLDARGRARVRAARDRAAAELARGLSAPAPRELTDTLGMPTPFEATAMARALASRLWPPLEPPRA